jgi:hypothetical protein
VLWVEALITVTVSEDIFHVVVVVELQNDGSDDVVEAGA